jgi:hypothetical protein
MSTQLATQVRALFSGCSFGEPASDAELAGAENELGEAIPDVLKQLYLAFNGFRGPTNAAFLWPLSPRVEDELSLTATNRWLRDEEEPRPGFARQYLFFGDAGIGSMWGIDKSPPGKVILWDPEWGEDFEDAGADPLEAWLAEKKRYDDIERNLEEEERMRPTDLPKRPWWKVW